MKNPKLYQTLTRKQLTSFLLKNGVHIDTINERLSKHDEIMDKEADLFGDFILFERYKFKVVYSEYQCLETPTDKHVKQTVHAFKAPNDHYKR